MIKYLLCPGIVISKTDSDRHYIGPHKLMALYKVDRAECATFESHREHCYEGLIVLKPRYDGDYKDYSNVT